MSLKLFRHTGFHSILSPGETRVALHPGWAVLAVSLWIGLACNVWLWLALARHGNPTPPLLAGLSAAATAGAILSLFGWRRTFKPLATVALVFAALVASGVWTQAVTLAMVLEGRRVFSLLPSWTSLFGWQVPTLLVLLGLVPVLWLWNTQLRRLSGGSQWNVNLAGLSLYAPIAVACWWLLNRTAA